jgi:hypothetical protein
MKVCSKFIYSVLFAFGTAAIVGCSDDGSSPESQEPAASTDDKWFDAGGVELIYDGQIRMDAINAGKDQFAADKSCAAMLPMAQKSLSDSSNAGTDVQVMYKTCNDAGLKFQNKVRCEAGRLQVLCR